VVEFVVDLAGFASVDDLGVGFRGGVHVDGGDVVFFANRYAWEVNEFFSRTAGGFERSRVTWSATMARV